MCLCQNKRRVIVIGDPLLRGAEGSSVSPRRHTEVCCLSGAWVRDVTGRLHRPVRPSDYCPLLIVLDGSNEVTERRLNTIKRDFRGLEQLMGNAGVQVVVSSPPSVPGKDTEWLKG